MRHAIAAVFENHEQAERATDELVAEGFSRDMVRLSRKDAAGQGGSSTETGDGFDAGTGGDSFLFGIKNFFSDLFGTGSHGDAALYSEAVMRGNYVLTLETEDEALVARATDIVERHHPIDIHDRAAQWQGGAFMPSASPDDVARSAMREGAGARQSADPGSGASMQAHTMRAGPGSAAGSLADSEAYLGAYRSGVRGDSEQRADIGQSAIPVIPVIEEELKVGKRTVQGGGVRVFRRVVETPVQESIGLREERVTVERQAVDRPASVADLGAFQEGTFEVRESVEQPVVEKVARVVEQVVVGKQVSEREQQISDTVRSTEVEIEQLPASAPMAGSALPGELEEANYRGHWQSNYADQGGSYDDYAPAYRYGASLTEQYGGRDWNEIEAEARSTWEARHSGQAWERMKNAVRRGWDKMTG